MAADTAPPQPTDPELLARIARGDRAAFHTFYERYAGRVLGYARRLEHDADLAEDVAQEVFLAVWTKAATYRADRGDAAGWLYTLTRNKLVDAWRRPERRAEVDSPSATAGERAVREPHREGGDLRLVLRQALSLLCPEQREAIALAYFGDLTYEETAGALALPVGTLKSRIRVGLRSLRELLA